MAENNLNENKSSNTQILNRPLQRFVYIVIAIMGIATIIMMSLPLFRSDFLMKISNEKVARGMITYVFVLGTTAIAVILTLGILLRQDKHIENRYRLGREVLSILIGVVGTIIGFYFGTPGGENISMDSKNSSHEQKADATTKKNVSSIKLEAAK